MNVKIKNYSTFIYFLRGFGNRSFFFHFERWKDEKTFAPSFAFFIQIVELKTVLSKFQLLVSGFPEKKTKNH